MLSLAGHIDNRQEIPNAECGKMLVMDLECFVTLLKAMTIKDR